MSSAKLKRVLAKLQAEYGDDSFMTLDEVPLTGAISSGSLSLDYATGIGGLPDNRVVEFAGANGAGKSTLAFRAIDNALEKNPDRLALYLDVEGRISQDWARKHVMNHERLFISQPTTAEEATDYYTGAVGTGDFCVAVFDSIGGAPTQRVSGKSATIGNVGGNALAITRFAGFAQTFSNKYRCLTIGVNQIRDDMAGYNRLMCLTGDTRVLTNEGIRPISELAERGYATVLNGNRGWEEVPVYEFEEDDVWEIDIVRNGRSKTIRTNSGHRWPIRRIEGYRDRPESMAPTHEVTRGTCDDESCPLRGECHCVLYCGKKTRISGATSKQRKLKHGNPMLFFEKHGMLKSGLGHSRKGAAYSLGDIQFITTENLKVGDYLTSNRPNPRFPSEMWNWGVAWGFVFGDGTAGESRGSLSIHDSAPKDQDIMPYLSAFKSTRYENRSSYYGFPRSFKKLPDWEESNELLYSWLAGYYSADGSLKKDGTGVLTSVSRENLEFVRDLCDRLGVLHDSISERKYGDKSFKPGGTYYDLEFPVGAFPEEFYLLQSHRKNFRERVKDHRRWKVVDVRKTNYREKMYCAKVDSTETFTLEDYILTGNTPGGQAWRHATSLRIELKRKTKDIVTAEVDGQEITVGHKVSAKIHKNSLGRAGTAIEYWLYTVDTAKYGPVGVDQNQELINLSILTGILEKGGAGMYAYDDFPKGKIRGYDNVIKFLLKNEDVFEKMRGQLLEKLAANNVDGVFENFEARDETFEIDS